MYIHARGWLNNPVAVLIHRDSIWLSACYTKITRNSRENEHLETGLRTWLAPFSTPRGKEPPG